MQLVVFADEHQKEVLLSKNGNKNIHFEFVKNQLALRSYKYADAIFILSEQANLNVVRSLTKVPVFINSVTVTLSDLDLHGNVSRINAWPTFLEKDILEVATKAENVVNNLFPKLGWRFIVTPDEPGLIAARVIAMIINEAYFAFGEGVSSKEQIDIAMKLGTNYPYGPFEWAKKIGLMNIYKLLKALNEESKRYTVAPAMEKELLG